MFENLLFFLRNGTEYYPFSYPAPEMVKQAEQYFGQQHDRLTRGMLPGEYAFGWELDREEEALAILVNTELLISNGKRLLMNQWLKIQPDEVFDLIDAYCEFNGYAL